MNNINYLLVSLRSLERSLHRAGLTSIAFVGTLLACMACIARGQNPDVVTLSASVGTLSPTEVRQTSYVKASNTHATDYFGSATAVSGDLMVIGAFEETSRSSGINGDQRNTYLNGVGAAYAFTRKGNTWSQSAYLKPSNSDLHDQFGWSVGVAANTIVVGARRESSSATGVNGNQGDNSASSAGAAYVFFRDGTNWLQQGYLKAINSEASDEFGYSVAVSGDTIVVGAPLEDSGAVGINGDGTDNSGTDSGAVYVYRRSGTNWLPEAFLKASNAEAGDRFGWSVSISGDSILVGAYGEDSSANVVNGNQANGASAAGAGYVFVRHGTNWSQEAYLKAGNAGRGDQFGVSVSISGDTAVIGSNTEDSKGSGINALSNDNSAVDAGAAYIFKRSGTNWSQEAFIKASNTGGYDQLGATVAISGDVVVVGAPLEDSSVRGIDQNPNDSASDAGAAYVFVRRGTNWNQASFIKSSNTRAGDRFGAGVSISGETIVIGAPREDSNAVGVDGNQSNNAATDSGAVFVFSGVCSACPQLASRINASSGLVLSFTGAPGLSYLIQRSISPNGPWDTIANVVAPTSGFVDYSDSFRTSDAAFYRVSQP